jgi:hypothetical protein
MRSAMLLKIHIDRAVASASLEVRTIGSFVYYDHGGFADSTELDFFRLTSAGDVVGIWHANPDVSMIWLLYAKDVGVREYRGPHGLVW